MAAHRAGTPPGPGRRRGGLRRERALSRLPRRSLRRLAANAPRPVGPACGRQPGRGDRRLHQQRCRVDLRLGRCGVDGGRGAPAEVHHPDGGRQFLRPARAVERGDGRVGALPTGRLARTRMAPELQRLSCDRSGHRDLGVHRVQHRLRRLSWPVPCPCAESGRDQAVCRGRRSGLWRVPQPRQRTGRAPVPHDLPAGRHADRPFHLHHQ